ncbi:uncharacterized protein LOC115589827 isoform X2 [Sparus aurata]|uniref:uncharacterized protein LOC115589827 isoform X2 n=1 Tax=Sparus aurata TaxID=8175 RepID=UPI0011C1C512|nr:uncharacterized protein LOC115589827 isoform X2 [Sparus aurata]
MLSLSDELSLKAKLSSFRPFILQHTVILLLLAGSGSSKPLKSSDNAEEQAGFFSNTSPSYYLYCIIFDLGGGIVGGLVLIVFLYIVWKCTKNKIKAYIFSAKKEASYDKKDQLLKQTQKTQEELDAWGEVLSPLTELKTGVENQRETFRLQLEEIENEREENKKKLQSVEKEIAESEKEKATDRTEGYLREKKALLNAQWKLEKRKEEVEKQQLNMDKLLQKTEGMNVTVTDRKRKVENQMEVIKSHLGELDSNDENARLH